MATVVINPTEVNLTLTNADTEYSTTIPARAKYFAFQCRTTAEIRFAFVTGRVAVPTGAYLTLKSGQQFQRTRTRFIEQKIYFASDTSGAIIEIYYD